MSRPIFHRRFLRSPTVSLIRRTDMSVMVDPMQKARTLLLAFTPFIDQEILYEVATLCLYPKPEPTKDAI